MGVGALRPVVVYLTVPLSLFAAAGIGAVVADRFGARRPSLYALLPGVGVLATIPFIFGFVQASSWQMSLALLIPPLILSTFFMIPAMALLQNRAPARYRATASSILLLVLNLVGLGLGPLAVGALSDALTPTRGGDALGFALLGLAPVALIACVLQGASARALSRESRDPAGSR